MNQKEKDGLKEILGALPEASLVDIANRTGGAPGKFGGASSKDEMVAYIIKTAASSGEILHRQKVHKDALGKYLEAKKVKVGENAKRQEFIRRCLELWGAEDGKAPGDSDRKMRSRAPNGV